MMQIKTKKRAFSFETPSFFGLRPITYLFIIIFLV